MKNIILTLIMLSFLSCKAQTPVLSLYDDPNYGSVQGAYYKDIEGFQDQFIGTWLYTNGNTSLKVVFVKKVMFYDLIGPITYYEDNLIGGSQYIENGVEKYDTTASVDETMETIYNYFILSVSRISKTAYPTCPSCDADEKRLRMQYDEPISKEDKCLSADFVMRHVVENGVEKLKVQFIKTSESCGTSIEEGAPTNGNLNFELPYGEYILIKQN